MDIYNQMQETADMELLRQYAGEGSEAAFAALVRRHVNLVYSVALRKTGNPYAAEEITQAVFVVLARKAPAMGRETILAGWLYQAARLTAANYLRNEIRRVRREQEASMESLANETDWPPSGAGEPWTSIEPLLDDAMGRLNEKERNAIVLRFFQGKSFSEIGAAFGGSENAAKKRVIHGLEKLRNFFLKRGVDSTAAAIGETISANSIQAAPVALAKTVTAVALAKGATASTSTLTLIKGALKIMAWTKAKTAIVVGVVAILAATSTTVIGIRVARAHRPVAEPLTGLSPVAHTVTADIQPDGTILFQSTIEETNNTGQTITTDNINDADTTWRATDESGRLLKITKRPKGGIYVALNRPVSPGGTISYTMAGKIAGFLRQNGAGEYEIGMSGDIGNETEAHLVEVWRLPAGAVLLGKDRGMEESTNGERIELRMDRVVPPNGTFPIGFRYRLPTNAN